MATKSEGEDEHKEINQPNDALFEKVKNTILQLYEPVTHSSNADLRMTTLEVYEAMQKIYPSNIYGLNDVANWLHEKGFSFWDAGSMRFEWLLKSAT